MSLFKDFLYPAWSLLEALFSGLVDVILECGDALLSFVDGIKELPLLLSNFASALDPAGVGLLSIVIVGFALLILRIILSIF